ncbi:unnamed protein product [Rotaria magnacalcarata]|uniref:Uncharacterized protein n=1 Tax=Rotaria magnacalcarata TaxID=392030 RepID=A0A818XZR0_9BILA|nr:unnamed protein product [Rotaria magnacalcarata]CAF3815884.1 unnamed protein product [Rotaria magnacalcarata]
MPKNKGKGGKNENMKRELILKDNGQSYAQVTRILGSGYIEAFCFDNTDNGQSYAQVTRILGSGYIEAFCFDNTGGKKRLCHIRADEARELKRIREIPDNVNITEASTNNHDGVEDVIFDDRHNSDASSSEEELPRDVNVRASTDESFRR